MGLFDRRRRPELPAPARAAVPLGPGEKVLAWATDADRDSHVVATTHHLALVAQDGSLEWQRPWHDAESGTWQGESQLLTVLWVDHRRPAQWRITQPSLLQQVLRERIQASVVLADEFRTDERRSVRIVIRQDLATGQLLEQVIPGKGADVDDPEVAAQVRARLARLRADVGLSE